MIIFAKITDLKNIQVCATLQPNGSFLIQNDLSEAQWNEYIIHLKNQAKPKPKKTWNDVKNLRTVV